MKTFKDTLTLEDALSLQGPRAFNIMLKPAGSLCNLSCRYCYYLDKASIYGGRQPRMSLEILERFVREYIKANDVNDIFFNWHGGEPLVMGLDFYRKAMEFEKKYADGKTVHNTIQTNATLIDNDWATFFRENDFLVGVSIDGPREIHDKYRMDKGGAPTFDKVLKGIRTLYDEGVEYNTMTTVNRQSEGHGLETYHFLKSIGGRFMQFMPVVETVKHNIIVPPDTEGAEIAPWSVSPEGFGKFVCDIFDYWVRNDVGQYFVNLFDCTLANWCGVPPGTCSFAETCGGNAVVEHNGDIYPCDHFVYPEYKLGNALETDLRTLMESAAQTRFGIDKRNGLPSECLRCEWFFACHGECPKHRFNKTESGETGLNALCEGFKMIFSHTAPFMEKMREQLLYTPAA